MTTKPEPLLVAVYGSLRHGLSNHRLLTTSKLLGTDTLLNLSMYSLGAYPYVTESTKNKTVFIEVYAVTSDVFDELDRLEGYPSFYTRKLVKTSFGNAWIYYINHFNNTDHEPVQGGDWVEFLNNR